MLRRLLSWIFILASRTRLYLYKKGLLKSIKVDARVVSIGNISMGGSGKTPMVLKLANEAANRGSRAVLIERGYKGELSSQIVCAEKGLDIAPNVKIIGDEAQMVWDSLSKGIRMCVSKSKAKGAKAAKEKWPDTKMIIVDDGFQHLQLKRDVDVVLIDAVSGFDGKVFPHGTLKGTLFCIKTGGHSHLHKSRRPFQGRTERTL